MKILYPLFCILTGLCTPVFAAEPPRPNVLFFFTDDQTFDTIRALGNEAIETPHLDSLVNEGVAFTRAYIMGGSSPAVCSPSRASLFSGRTLWNLENQGPFGYEISEAHRTLFEVFRESGYTTFATGKNEPGRRGHFSRSFSTGDKILFRGMTRTQYNMPLFAYPADGNFRAAKPVAHKGTHSAEIYADATIAFLEKQSNADQPFVAYVAFQTPHDPREFPESYGELYPVADMVLPESFQPVHPFDNGMLKIRDEKLAPFPRTPEVIRKHLSDYYATITHTDAQIGRVLDRLEQLGLKDNTLIVFTSDNGLAMGQHGLMGKQNVYDHSVHVPFLLAGPGLPQGEVREQLIYIYDIYPTLCEMAGIPVPETVEFRSLNPVLKDATSTHREHLYFAFMSWQRAIQDERFKLIEYCVDGQRFTQLFDVEKNPSETHNLAGDPAHAQTLHRLRQLLEQERVRLNDGNTPYPLTDGMGKAFWNTYESTLRSTIPE